MNLLVGVAGVYLGWVATDTLGVPTAQHWAWSVLIGAVLAGIGEIAGHLRRIAEKAS